MKEIVLYTSSTDKINNCLVDQSYKDKQNSISDDMSKLMNLLLKIKNIDLTKSSFSNFPLVGNLFDNMKRESIREKYSNTKTLIDELTTEVNIKCADLKQSNIVIDETIQSLKDDIKNNKKEYDRLMKLYKKYTEEDNNNKKDTTNTNENFDVENVEMLDKEIGKNNALIIIASGLKDLNSLIKNQAVHLAEFNTIKNQNITFIHNVTATIKSSISNIATSLIKANHLYKRNEVLEIANACRDIASNMTTKTVEAMKVQTEKYKQLLIEEPVDEKRLNEAIENIRLINIDFNNFTKNQLPRIVKKIEDSSGNIESILNVVDNIESKRKEVYHIKA